MSYFDNIILGGGASGLQCAYFFQKSNINYIILEKNNICGSFFDQYPHSGKLISINKIFTGNDSTNEFKLRHDWNSLLTYDDFKFTEYTNDYYPNKECIVNYLNDFLHKYSLNIEFNKDIVNVSKITDSLYKYKLITKTNDVYFCKNLIIGTGLSKCNIPKFEINVFNKIKHYGQYPKDYFKKNDNLFNFINKDICLIGGGNSSYELANMLNGHCRSVTIFSNKHRDWSMCSHYSGDIRSIYLPFMDTFLLKSLNAIDKTDRSDRNNSITQTQPNGKYKLQFISKDGKRLLDYSNIDYDNIIFCTGWAFDTSIYDFDIDIIYNKYPHINNNYESTNNKNLFFIGSLMHSLDYRKSSGGFIHGFRYLIHSFFKMNYHEFDNSFFELKTEHDYKVLVDHILKRFNNASSIYQMFGYMGDILYYNFIENQVFYYYDIPVNCYNKIIDENVIRISLTLEYNSNIINDITVIGNKYSTVGTECTSTLIHPVIKVFNYCDELLEIIHLDEDLYAEFKIEPIYYDRIYRLFKSYVGFTR